MSLTGLIVIMIIFSLLAVMLNILSVIDGHAVSVKTDMILDIDE